LFLGEKTDAFICLKLKLKRIHQKKIQPDCQSVSYYAYALHHHHQLARPCAAGALLVPVRDTHGHPVRRGPAGADIIMCLSRSEENSFTGELGSNQLELALLLQAIDAEEAEATVESDKAMIFGRIREDIGFEAFIAKLCDTLLER
jgi:hypothetical protein